VSCARFDQRGVGRSEALEDRWDLVAYARDVEAIRSALNLERLCLVGHSWGGVVARAYAKRHPARVSGLLLISPSTAIGPEWAALERHVLARVRRGLSVMGWLKVGLSSLQAMLPGALGDRGMAAVYRGVLRSYTGAKEAPAWVAGSRARAARKTRQAIQREDPRALDGLGLPADVPYRMLFGDAVHDIYGPTARVLAARIADEAETTFLDGAGHLPWVTHPDAFEAWLDEGLRRSGIG
jgi:proline iminopeptidase